jgi:hypothetical protein
VNPGTYSASASFASGDPNYANASGTTSITVTSTASAPAMNLVSNETFDTNASGWTLGGGCGDESWVGGVGNPPGSVQLNACGESNSNPVAFKTVSGFLPGHTYTVSVDVRVHVPIGPNGRSFGVFVDTELNPIFLGEFIDGTWHTVTASFTALGPTHTIILAGELDQRTPGVPTSTDVSYYIDNVSVRSNDPVVIEWPVPAPITYGTPLSSAQLNATANVNGSDVPGAFAYSPTAGTVLPVGNHDLSVTFTPNDTNYPAATRTIPLRVVWAPGAGLPISYEMRNGYGYLDQRYNGLGCATCDHSMLSGGLGELTDGVLGTVDWSGLPAVPWVGWVRP